MKSDGKVKDKSYAFALRVVRVARSLQDGRREVILSKQLLRSGTSIGANVEEANAAVSKKDFIAKMAIASKEARETHYWLRLLKDSELLEKDVADATLAECEELVRMLTAIVKTAQQNSD